MKRPFHPILFALYPTLSLYAANARFLSPSQILWPWAATLAFTALLWLVLAGITRSWSRSARAASIVVLAVFLYAPISDVPWVQSALPGFALVFWLSLSLIVVLAVRTKEEHEKTATAGFNAAAIVLLALSCVTILGAGAGTPTTSGAASEGVADRRLPDVLYIILDGYGRADAIERAIGHSNEPFIRALGERGFQVADRSVANYLQTQQSMASSLNLQSLETLVKGSHSPMAYRAELDRAIDQSLVADRFRDEGYRYVAVTTGFPAFKFESADTVLNVGGEDKILAAALWAKTPFRDLALPGADLHEEKRRKIRHAFQSMEDLGSTSRSPMFLVAHILAPHPPFVFRADGSAAPAPQEYSFRDGSHYMEQGASADSYREGYAAQLEALNRMILEMIDGMDRRAPDRDPIIILQGDHGSKVGLDYESLANSDIAEAASILLAVRGRGLSIPDDTTPWNVFRHVLGHLFATDSINLPNRTYYSTWSDPATHIECTAEAQAGMPTPK